MGNEIRPSKKNSLAITHICWALLLIGVTTAVFTYPNLFEDAVDFFLLELPEVTDPVTLIFWIFFAIINVIIFLGVIIFIVLAKLMAIFIVMLIALPSLIGGLAMIKPRLWAFKLLVFSGIFSVLVPPLGTVLGIWTIRAYSKEGKTRKQIEKNTG